MIATPKTLSWTSLKPDCNGFGTLNEWPSSPLSPQKLRSEHVEGLPGDRQRSQVEEDRLHPEREKADSESQRRRGDEPYHKRAQVRAYRVQRETNGGGADAKNITCANDTIPA